MRNTALDIVNIRSNFAILDKQYGELNLRSQIIKKVVNNTLTSNWEVTGNFTNIVIDPYIGQKEMAATERIDDKSGFQNILTEELNASYRYVLVEAVELLKVYLINQAKLNSLYLKRKKEGEKIIFLSKQFMGMDEFRKLAVRPNILDDIKISVYMAVEFRNIIVHDSGAVNDFNTLVEKIFSKHLGWGGGAKHAQVYDFVGQYVGSTSSPILPDQLVLLERGVQGSRLPRHYYAPLLDILSRLHAFGRLVKDALEDQAER